MISVTQLLETFPERELVDWQLRVGAAKAKQVSEEALRVGSVVDRLIQDSCRSLLLGVSPRDPAVQACCDAWCLFQKDHPTFRKSIVGIQQEVTNGVIIGHLDFLLRQAGGWGVCEVKCAAQIRPIHWTQVAAYSWLKNPEVNADFLAVLRLDKMTGRYEYVELTDPDQIDYEVQVWLNYKVLYEHRLRVEERARTQKEDAVLSPVDEP